MELIIGKKTFQDTTTRKERAILVGVDQPNLDWPLAESLAELGRLVETADAEVVGTQTQRLARPIPKTYIGVGKATEIADMAKELDADVIVFDDELSPSQQANLERIMGEDIKVIDRTALILDIFGRHASTREGRIQVQLAQNQYLLPRLRGMWSHLTREQTRGGIGSRFGQGESQLEVDRRLVRNRISALQSDLKRLERRRQVQSKARWDSGVYRVALVGYTNAGKSTLLNALTGSSIYAKDELFATLDPTTRTLELEEGRKITITDTVGFIQKLPTTLVESFKSTLAEVVAANLVLLIVDVADVNAHRQIDAVRAVLDEISASDIPQVVVFNKCDLLSPEDLRAHRLAYPEAEHVSALQADGLRSLLFRVAKEAAKDDITLTACIPYDKGMLISALHERCQILHEQYEQDGLMVTAKMGPQVAAMVAPYVR